MDIYSKKLKVLLKTKEKVDAQLLDKYGQLVLEDDFISIELLNSIDLEQVIKLEEGVKTEDAPGALVIQKYRIEKCRRSWKPVKENFSVEGFDLHNVRFYAESSDRLYSVELSYDFSSNWEVEINSFISSTDAGNFVSDCSCILESILKSMEEQEENEQ